MGDAPTLDEVFRKYGETAEAAQLLETELGTLLLNEQCIEEELFGADGIRATEIMRSINRATVGSLIRKLKPRQSVEDIDGLLEAALKARNRLIHSFYREHNMRKFSGDGRYDHDAGPAQYPRDYPRCIQGPHAVGRDGSR